MLRKHFNCMSREELQHVPFYSWQCLTLCLKHRDVDLVIPDEGDMDLLLKFLIPSMYMMDGKRDSARKLVNLMNKHS